MRSKLVQGRKSINCANSVLPAYILNPRERVPENLADTRFYVQVDTTPKAKIPSSTQQVARYSRVLSRTAVRSIDFSSLHARLMSSWPSADAPLALKSLKAARFDGRTDAYAGALSSARRGFW